MLEVYLLESSAFRPNGSNRFFVLPVQVAMASVSVETAAPMLVSRAVSVQEDLSPRPVYLQFFLFDAVLSSNHDSIVTSALRQV